MLLIDSSNLTAFLDRFFRFYDGVVERIDYEYHPTGEKTASIQVYGRDKLFDKIQTLRFVFKNVQEINLREKNYPLCILSSGIAIKWVEDCVWVAFQPYSVQMETKEDYRKSDFYLVCRACYWELANNHPCEK